MDKTILSSMAMVALWLAAGCSYDPATFPGQDELYGAPPPDGRTFDDQDDDYPGFVLRTPRETVITARVDDGGILGFDVNLGRYQDPDDRSIRGNAFQQWLDLKVTNDRVTGVVMGTLPVDVVSAREGGALRVRGLMRGYPMDYRLDEQRLAGSLGRCSYDLARAGDHHYQGKLDCNGEQRVVRLKLPPELTRWSDPEIGAALGLLLGGT
jgi:hypothetical protein